MKRSLMLENNREKKFFTKRFYPAGTYTWSVPRGCTEVEVFVVGAGGGALTDRNNRASSGGGGGYTKTYRGRNYVKPSSGTWMGSSTDGRDGNAIPVKSGQQIEIIVGAGVAGSKGGYSQFMNSNYQADGGHAGAVVISGHGDGNGGSGGAAADSIKGGSDGSDGDNSTTVPVTGGIGQNHTTRDFGEPTGKRNAGGGTSVRNGGNTVGGISDYYEGSGEAGTGPNVSGYLPGKSGGGYGGGAGAPTTANTNKKGGDGTVLIRYWAYEE